MGWYESGQIRGLLDEHVGGAALDRARLQQSRIAFHAVKRTTSWDIPRVSMPLVQFLSWVENILPHDKYVRFKSLFRFPVKTNEICDVIFDKLSRIFDGRNASYSYLFADSSMADDWERYRATVLHEPEIWSTKGWEFFRSEINSVLVCDLPETEGRDLPEPYFWWLPIEDVLSFRADPSTGQMDYIVFRNRDRIVALDDGHYRVWEDRNRTGCIVGEPVLERPHDLGYCPARFFWNVPIALDDPDVKCSPLSAVLESLDWFEFFHISKRQLDLMGAYPILSGYEQSCDFSNAENGDYCDGGYLRDRQGRYRLDPAGLPLPCPKCGNRRIVGPGSFVEIPVPNGEEGQPDLRNPVQMLTVDKDALVYNVDEQRRLREEIITAVVGQDEIVTDRDAFNEQQVRANFESVTTVLNRVKRGFEAAQKWADETVCRLRYGRYFISASISYGTEFYLASPDELREKYKSAKESGAPESELDALQARILETEYRSDPIMLRRMRLLADLEPFRHLDRAELAQLWRDGLIGEDDYLVKLNFSSLVRRFERENTSVLDFGSELPYAAKVDRIVEELRRYARELPRRGSTNNQPTIEQ